MLTFLLELDEDCKALVFNSMRTDTYPLCTIRKNCICCAGFSDGGLGGNNKMCLNDQVIMLDSDEW